MNRRNHRRIHRGLKRQRGVGLLEVLIAVVILSFGLLGIAGLQLTTMRNNQSALERSMAVTHSYSIVDAMHADRTNATNGVFNIGLDDDAPTGSTFADNAVADWRADLLSLLGAEATGSIACNGTDCTVTVRWNDERASGGSSVQTISTQVQL